MAGYYFFLPWSIENTDAKVYVAMFESMSAFFEEVVVVASKSFLDIFNYISQFSLKDRHFL